MAAHAAVPRVYSVSQAGESRLARLLHISMKQYTAVFNSSLVNRQGSMFSVRGLESTLEQGWREPRVSNLGHDAHRPVGWAETLALHLQPKVARLLGRISVAESPEECAAAARLAQHLHSKRIAEVDPAKRSVLHDRIKQHLSSDALVALPGCIAYKDSGLAQRVFPAAFDHPDKDGLIALTTLRPVLPGVFEHDGLIFFAHPFFRRALSRLNSLNDPFLRRLQAAAANGRLDVRIALDTDLVGLAETALASIELQYWWGPHFSDDLPDVRLGVSQHGNDEIERLFTGILRTEFWWYEQNERTFECEEVLDNPSLGVSTDDFGSRFVHSIVDAKTGTPKHLDGAVRMYDEEGMLARLEADLMHAGRRSRYTKLWRIDHELDVSIWKALISDYFRDNHLVGEYLGGTEDDVELTRPRTIALNSPDAPITDFSPCTMSAGDGVRISISYHRTADSVAGERVFLSTEEITLPSGQRSYVEACTIDLIKLLRRRGNAAELQDAAVVAFEDLVFGLPLVAHCGPDARRDAQRTIDVIAEYTNALVRHQQDRMLGFHIGIRFADRDTFFSFAGHVNDLQKWFASDSASLPQSQEEIGRWAERAMEQLSRMFPHARDVPPVENMFKVTGLLTIDRKILDRDEYDLANPLTGAPVVELKNHPNVTRALPLIRDKRLTVAPAWQIITTACNHCGGAYETCSCIKFIDTDVADSVTDARLLGFFWTDRSAHNIAWTLPEAR